MELLRSLRPAQNPFSRPAASAGLLLTHPPYGTRIGNPGRLRDLYATLGKLASGRTVGSE